MEAREKLIDPWARDTGLCIGGDTLFGFRTSMGVRARDNGNDAGAETEGLRSKRVTVAKEMKVRTCEDTFT